MIRDKLRVIIKLSLAIAITFFSVSHVSAVQLSGVKPKLKLVVTIKPLYNLVAAITKDINSCDLSLLLEGNTSPHDYSLKLKDLNLMETADLIVWGGDQLETFLVKLFKQTKFNPKLMTIGEFKTLKYLKFRSSSYIDEHWWLSPYNARVIVSALERKLSQLDPGNAKLYKLNKKKFLIKLARVDSIVKQKLKVGINGAYLVFHDAYQYFEKFYTLKAPIVISDNPAMPLSMKRVTIIRELIDKKRVKCLFKEPQFDSKVLDSLIESSNLNQELKVGILDPIGLDEDLGPEGYFKLMLNLANSFNQCFAN